MALQCTAEIYEERVGGYSSVCPELVIASQGETIEEARAMLIEAIELTLEDMTPQEYEYRVSGQMSANSHISENELRDESVLVESSVVEVNVNLPFVSAR